MQCWQFQRECYLRATVTAINNRPSAQIHSPWGAEYNLFFSSFNCQNDFPFIGSSFFFSRLAPELMSVANLLYFFFSFFFPSKPPVHSCIFQLSVLLVVLCEMPPQHGSMSRAMPAPWIPTSETLGHCSRVHELNHSAMGRPLRNNS